MKTENEVRRERAEELPSVCRDYFCDVCGSAGYIRQIADNTALCSQCFNQRLYNIKHNYQKNNKNEILPLEITKEMLGEHIVIPDFYEEIADFAFDRKYEISETGQSYKRIESIFIPAEIKVIGYRSLNALSLKDIIVDENNEYFSSIDGVLFNKDQTCLIKMPCNKDITSYTVPDSVTTIKEEAFMSTRIRNIIFPEKPVIIEAAAFADCRYLEELNLPSVKRIYDTAFINCRNLKNITILDDNTGYTCEDGVLYNKDKTVLMKYPAEKPDEHFEIPDTVIVIGVDAFAYCRNLKSVTIPESVMIISNGAFADCKLEKLDLPDDLRLIGNRVFEGCRSLKEVFIPMSVTDISPEEAAIHMGLFRCGAKPITVDNVLKQKVVTWEKNIYGFIRTLLLFSELNDLKPIDVISKMGNRYITSISIGWGDFSYISPDRCLSDWHRFMLNESKRYDTYAVKDTVCEAVREKADIICNEIFKIKETSEKEYSEIIREYFTGVVVKDIVIFQAYCKKTDKNVQFTIEDLYGYEGEVCGIIDRNTGMVISYNSGCGFDGMNPDIEISVVSVNGKKLRKGNKA